MACATSSLPVPVSPVMSTVLMPGAIVSMRSNTSRIALLLPMILQAGLRHNLTIQAGIFLFQPQAFDSLFDRAP